MDREKRIRDIEKFVIKNNIVTIAELSAYLGVSESTVRRDIEIMVSRELVTQLHGSVTSCNFRGQGFEQFDVRKSENREKKTAIGRCVADFLHDGDVVFMEGGTTQLEIARSIREKNVTVVTLDINIGMALADSSSVTTILPGGQLWPGSYLLIGDIAEQAIRNMHFTHYFTTPGAIMADGRLIYHNIQLSSVRLQGMNQTDSIVVAVDSSKFGKTGFFSRLSLSDADVLISDAVPDEYRGLMSKEGRIIIAGKMSV